jgi:hypothetical protein
MLITMSDHEINRFKVLTDVQEKRLRQVDAADILNVSTRHVRRLLSQLATYGAQSLVHAARGRPSNRRYDDNFRAEVLRIVHEHYFDFSPTFALVNLYEHHNLIASKETFRQWMIADGLWAPYLKRKPRIYQSLYCRERVKVDGSHHDWFEGQHDKFCLLVFIDDATRQFINLRFNESKSHL